MKVGMSDFYYGIIEASLAFCARLPFIVLSQSPFVVLGSGGRRVSPRVFHGGVCPALHRPDASSFAERRSAALSSRRRAVAVDGGGRNCGRSRAFGCQTASASGDKSPVANPASPRNAAHVQDHDSTAQDFRRTRPNANLTGRWSRFTLSALSPWRDKSRALASRHNPD